jgi:hypothetical protein
MYVFLKVYETVNQNAHIHDWTSMFSIHVVLKENCVISVSTAQFIPSV